MTTPRDEARALRWMVDELRAEPLPAVDWERVEGRLLERIARRGRPRFIVDPPPVPSAFARVTSYVAAAAAIALVLGAGASSAPHASSATEPRVVAVDSIPKVSASSSARDAALLAVGDAVETGAEPATFEIVGSVRWTLAPHSRIVVRARAVSGIGQVVALERGAIEAEVTPRDQAEGMVEAFAVEAKGTRVAVHGTLFRVVREADRILVDVAHGTVAVGPTGHVGVTTGRLLVGPARAAFSFDGGRTARRLARTSDLSIAAAPPPTSLARSPEQARALDAQDSATAAERAPSVVAQPLALGAPDPVAPPSAAAEPPALEPAAEASAAPAEPPPLTEATVRGMLGQCYRSAYASSSSSVVVSVTSTLTMKLRADGSVQSARFDPPLEPKFQSCAGAIMSGRFSPGARTLTIPVSFGP